MKEDKKKGANVPNLRFPGFEGEWEEKELGVVSEISSGGTPSRTNPSYWDGNIPWVSTSLIDFNTIYQTEEKITEEGLKGSSAKLLPKGSLLMAMYGQGTTRGKVAILGIDAATNQACASIKPDPNVLTSQFLFYNLSKRYDEIRDLSNQGSQENLNGAIIKGIKLAYPLPSEQKKLTEFLSLIDERILTQSKIIEKYESLIKVLNEAFFCQKIRFHNSEGEWTTYRVSDFLEFFSTNSLSWEQLEYGTDNFYNLHYGLIHQSDSSQIDLTEYILPSIKAEFIPNNYSLCQDGDIAFADASEDTNDVAKSIEFFNCSNNKVVCGLHTIHGRDKLNITIPGFKGYAFSSKLFHHQVRRLAQGTKVFSISPKTFDNIYIDIPSKEEQTKIANFLLSIDKKIQIEKSLLDRYKKQKSYFLHELFL